MEKKYKELKPKYKDLKTKYRELKTYNRTNSTFFIVTQELAKIIGTKKEEEVTFPQVKETYNPIISLLN